MLARLNFIVKLTLILTFNIYALVFDKVENLILLTLAACVVWALSKPNIDKVKFTLMIVLPVMWSIILMQGLFYRAEPKTILLVLVPPNFPVIGWLTGGLYLYYQGLIYGLVQSLRFVSVILVGLAVAWSSTGSEIIRTLRNYVKSQKLTVSLSVAVRFLDTIRQEVKTVLTAVRLYVKTRSIFELMQHVVIPLISQSVRRSYTLTLALLSRGFSECRKVKTGVRLTVVDKILILLLIVPALVLAMLKILTVLFLYDMLYIPELSHVYKWVIDNL